MLEAHVERRFRIFHALVGLNFVMLQGYDTITPSMGCMLCSAREAFAGNQECLQGKGSAARGVLVPKPYGNDFILIILIILNPKSHS